ncbi:hypothetical protein, partial [Pseudomonas aeruginosa]|uniref:hypothetical protein n=1 Tax=Pseudomonas aeruginosa TaxID=287 RepID=UPI001ABCEAAF
DLGLDLAAELDGKLGQLGKEGLGFHVSASDRIAVPLGTTRRRRLPVSPLALWRLPRVANRDVLSAFECRLAAVGTGQ